MATILRIPGTAAILLAVVTTCAEADVRPAGSAAEHASDVEGVVVYTRHGRVRKVVIGEQTALDLGPGTFARWSPDGDRMAVYHAGKVFLMNADGTNRRMLVQRADSKDGCSIEFHTNNREIIYWLKGKGFHAVDIHTGQTRSLQLPGVYSGEPGISADGSRMAVRKGHELFAVDIANERHTRYARGCSPGVSPDGSRLMNNAGSHRQLAIRNWKGKGVAQLTAKGMKPDNAWDNHHWSNHSDYIAAQGEGGPGEAYVVRISDNHIMRASWEGNAIYPDVFVSSTPDLPSSAKNLAERSARPGTGKRKVDMRDGQEPFKVRCKLLARTATPDPKRLADYSRAMAEYAYEVVQDTGPLQQGTRIIVCHWVLIDRKPVPVAASTIGDAYTLTLDRFAAYPELEHERLLSDLDNFELPLFICMDSMGRPVAMESGEQAGSTVAVKAPPSVPSSVR